MGNPANEAAVRPAAANLGPRDDEYYDLPESGGIERPTAPTSAVEPGQSRSHVQTEGEETGDRKAGAPSRKSPWP